MTRVPEMIWSPNLRLCLAGLGQQATSLQSVWVASQLQRQIDVTFFSASALDPLDCLQDIRGRVIVLAEHLDFAPEPQRVLPEPPVESSMDLCIDDTSLTRPLRAFPSCWCR